MSTITQNHVSETREVKGDGDLPEGWASVLLPEICDINPPKPRADALPSGELVTFVPMPAVDAEAGAITRSETRPFSKVRKGFTAFQDGDVIFAKITPCMENGKAAVAQDLLNGFGFGSTEFHVIRSNGAVLPEYVHHFIRQESFRKDAEAEMTGSVGQKRVPTDFMKQIELPLPPLAEQERIAAKIEELLAQVKAARARLAKASQILKRFRQAVLAAACSGRLTEGWRVAGIHTGSGEPVEGWNCELLPNSWEMTSVGEIASVRGGKRLPKGVRYSETRTPFPYIRVTDFSDMTVRQGDLKYIDEKTRAKIARYTISDSDVYISIAGSIGKVGLISPNLNGANLTENAAKITNFKAVTKEYLAYALNSVAAQEQIKEFITSSGQPKLALFRIENLNLPLPPIVEQQEIVRRVEALFKLADAIERRVETGTKRADKLIQAILAKAFRGELVPTEAELARREGRSYESASDLLARVCMERQVKSGNRRNRHAPRNRSSLITG